MSDRRPTPWLPASTRLILMYFLAMLVAFTLMRIVFYAMYGNLATEKGVLMVARSFLLGLRFDIATASLLLLPWILLAHLPFTERRGVLLRRMITPILVIVGVVASLIIVADCLYYAHGAKRFSYEPLVFFQVGGELMEFALGEYTLLAPGLIAAVLLFWGMFWYRTRLNIRSQDPGTWGGRIKIVLWGCLLLGLSILGVRGGWQGKPLSISDAYFSNIVIINHASLNPVNTFLFSLVDNRTTYQWMPAEKALTTVRKALAVPGEVFEDDRYALSRTSTVRDGGPNGFNIVLIIGESLTAEFMGTYGNPTGATPRIDAIASRGVVFERFLSSGSRSSHGLFSSLFSVPAQLGSPVMHTSLILNNFRSLANVLRDHGYETIFIYGGVYEFTNAMGVLKNAGFEKIIGEPPPADPPIKRRTWGYDDEHMFARLLHEMSRPGERPRLVVLFTQNLHGRDVPEDFVKRMGGVKFTKETNDYGYYNLEYYTDWCIGHFIDEAKKQPFFDKTIFALTADHSNHSNPNLYENQHIPFIIYSPALLTPARYKTVGGQLDILPTLLGILNLKTKHASFGRNLLNVADRKEPGHAYLTLGHSVGWVEGPWILHDLLGEAPPKLFNFIEDPELKEDVAAQQADLARDFRVKARAFMQVSKQLLVENRIFPPAN